MPTLNQPPVKAGRERMSPRVLAAVRDCIEAEARQYGVSMSFVQSTHLARHYGIGDQPDFRKLDARRRK